MKIDIELLQFLARVSFKDRSHRGVLSNTTRPLPNNYYSKPVRLHSIRSPNCDRTLLSPEDGLLWSTMVTPEDVTLVIIC